MAQPDRYDRISGCQIGSTTTDVYFAQKWYEEVR